MYTSIADFTMREYTVPKEFENYRIDVFLPKKLPTLSRAMAQKLLKNGKVCVNGKTTSKPSLALKHNDKVELDIPAPKRTQLTAEEIPLDIVYEDEDLVVINKPFGMVVHPAHGHQTGTLVNALLHHCKDLSGIGGVERPGIVHRLDKDTSGLMVIAKNDMAHKKLSSDFKERKVTKKYLAVVQGKIKTDTGTVNEPIGRSTSDRKKMAVIHITTDEQKAMNNKKHRKSKSRDAITHFKVIKRLKDSTLVELKLETGRTHQIRVHLAHLGHPVIGDKFYGFKKDKADRMMLHSYLLGFFHPRTKKYLEFSAEAKFPL